MTKKELIELLSQDLMRERMHLAFYLYASSLVEGLHREEMSEFFMEQAASEMKHVKQFQDVILELGGQVPNMAKSFPEPFDFTPVALLRFALEMEDEVVANYVERLEQAAALGGVDGTYVSLFLEDQIMDSKNDAANIRRMLK